MQEAQLQSLASRGSRSDYEKRARQSLDSDGWEDFSWDDFDIEPETTETPEFDSRETLSRADR